MNKETIDCIQNQPGLNEASLKEIDKIESIAGNDKVKQFANLMQQQDEDEVFNANNDINNDKINVNIEKDNDIDNNHNIKINNNDNNND